LINILISEECASDDAGEARAWQLRGDVERQDRGVS